MINPKDVAFFVPPGLKKFKLALFNRIADHIQALGGTIVRDQYTVLEAMTNKGKIPIVGCSPPFAAAIKRWQADGTPWIYWDRGYLRRVFATWLPKGSDMGIPGGYYRWHLGTFQMDKIREVPADRWNFLKLHQSVQPWKPGGDKIVVAHTLPDYWNLRGLPEDWSFRIAADLKQWTDRPIVVRDKESKVPLYQELEGAHALVTHGSIAAVEAAIMGVPVFVDPSCAAALVGCTDFSQIENPVFPAREAWLYALAYSQWNEAELVNGTLWSQLQ